MRNGFSVHGLETAQKLSNLFLKDIHDFCEFETLEDAQKYHGKETIFFTRHAWGVITVKK